MAYIDKYGVEFTDDRKTLIKCPEDFPGEYIIPEEVNLIGNRAFKNCSKLTNINISNSVTKIEDYAFWGCSSLRNLFIPTGVKSIGRCAFVRCINISSIVVAKENPVFDSRNNCNAIINAKTDKLVLGCKNTIIPDSIISIGESAFSECIGLKNIKIPNGVRVIRGCAFSMCINLESVCISPTVVYIGFSAFANCSSLLSIEIPNSITSIQEHAFNGCDNLQQIVIPLGEKQRFLQFESLKYYVNVIVEH